MLPTAKPMTDPLRGARSRRGSASMLRHHVGLRLVDELVRQPLEPVGQRARPRELQLAPLGRLAARISSITSRDDRG